LIFEKKEKHIYIAENRGIPKYINCEGEPPALCNNKKKRKEIET
jgi:hypothetical protein